MEMHHSKETVFTLRRDNGGSVPEARAEANVDYQALASELEGLRGVQRVLVETRGGAVKTIHVESDLTRRAKAISADIQSKLAFMGLSVDYKKISIIEPKESRVRPAAAIAVSGFQPPRRLILKQVMAAVDQSGITSAHCVLKCESGELPGSFSGAGVPVESAVASCMLTIVQPLIHPHVLRVDVVKVDPALETVSIILTLTHTDNRSEDLTGMVKITGGDLACATAKAFLSATNRRIEVLLA